MPIDFRKMMTPEQREKWDEYRAYEADNKTRFAAMDDDTLANTAEYYMSQMSGPQRYGPGCPVYDAAFFHGIVPELLKRARKRHCDE